MNLKLKAFRTERTPHLDPLPFRRGEEKTTRARDSAAANDPAHGLLSPFGGEDQGEGAATQATRLHALMPSKTALSTKPVPTIQRRQSHFPGVTPMKSKLDLRRMQKTPHLDPLPFRRGEEKTTAPVRASTATDNPAHNFLSPIGGQDQGEGAAAQATRLRAFKPLGTQRVRAIRKPFLKFIGPNHQPPGA